MLKQELVRKWLTETLQKLQSQYSFDDAGKAILRIEAKLGRIRAFGHYNLDDISRAVGQYETDNALISEMDGGNQNLKVISRVEGFPDFYLTVLVGYEKMFFPRASIEIHLRTEVSLGVHKEFLVWLNKRLPNLSISRVDYIIDQFCVDPKGAALLFGVDRRCLHLSYSTKDRLEGHGTSPKDEMTSLNYPIGRYHKVIGVGSEEKKRGGAWMLSDIDRVRLVHTANRMKLKKYGINTLGDLIENPRYGVVNMNRWRFRQFLKARRGTRNFWRRSDRDSPVNASVKPAAKSAESNNELGTKFSYIENYRELVRIELRIDRAMKTFDLDWYILPD